MNIKLFIGQLTRNMWWNMHSWISLLPSQQKIPCKYRSSLHCISDTPLLRFRIFYQRIWNQLIKCITNEMLNAFILSIYLCRKLSCNGQNYFRICILNFEWRFSLTMILKHNIFTRSLTKTNPSDAVSNCSSELLKGWT